MTTSPMVRADGKHYEPHELPTLLFGHRKALAYVLNPKSACTLALNFVFYLNNGYRYFDPVQIHHSPRAMFRLQAADLDFRAVNAFCQLSPQSFSIVRNPLDRFVSGFLSKIFSDDDPHTLLVRDFLTSECGIDLSPEADAAQSCIAFAKWVASHRDQRQIDRHFRPQWLNLRIDSRFAVDTILRLEDRKAIVDFFAQWIGAEKAQWLVSFRFNERKKYKGSNIVSDELKSLVETIYAKDYELFYA